MRATPLYIYMGDGHLSFFSDPDPLFILFCDPFPDPDPQFVTLSFPDHDPDITFSILWFRSRSFLWIGIGIAIHIPIHYRSFTDPDPLFIT